MRVLPNVFITQNIYFALQRSLAFAQRKFKIESLAGSCISIEFFLSLKCKSSRPFRKVLASTDTSIYQGKNLIQKYCQLTNIATPVREIAEGNFSLWNESFLPVELRVFALQLIRNSLPVNARLGARYRGNLDVNIDEGCRNCKIENNLVGPVYRETFFHFFWECNFARKILEKFKEQNYPTLDNDGYKRLVFLGIAEQGDFCLVTRVLSVLLLFEIWKNRSRKKCAASFATIILNMEHTLEKIFSGNFRIKKLFTNKNILFIRNRWPADRQGRG
jgi:hypothetical protein